MLQRAVLSLVRRLCIPELLRKSEAHSSAATSTRAHSLFSQEATSTCEATFTCKAKPHKEVPAWLSQETRKLVWTVAKLQLCCYKLGAHL